MHTEQQVEPAIGWWIGRFNGETVRSAADQLPFAAPARMPV